METINIKGKEYITVNERIKHFRTILPLWSMTTEIIRLDNEVVVMKAIIKNEEGRIIAEGTAFEKAGSSFINKTSYIENCETSAWGRALGNLGIGIDTSVASAEEVTNAINNQGAKPADYGEKVAILEEYLEAYKEQKNTEAIKYIEDVLKGATYEKLVHAIETIERKRGQ